MEVVNALVDAVGRTPSVRLLDYSSDTAHNRSVLTMAGDATSLKTAVVALFEAALPRIDLRQHTGEHPRLGAVDVVPFVPITDVTMDECVRLAKETAAEVADRFLCTRRRPAIQPARISRTFDAESSRGSKRRCPRQAGCPISALLDRIPPQARPSWAPACR